MRKVIIALIVLLLGISFTTYSFAEGEDLEMKEMDMSNDRVFSSISNDGKTVTVRGVVTLDYHALINGVIRRYSRDIEHSFSYSVN